MTYTPGLRAIFRVDQGTYVSPLISDCSHWWRSTCCFEIITTCIGPTLIFRRYALKVPICAHLGNNISETTITSWASIAGFKPAVRHSTHETCTTGCEILTNAEKRITSSVNVIKTSAMDINYFKISLTIHNYFNYFKVVKLSSYNYFHTKVVKLPLANNY